MKNTSLTQYVRQATAAVLLCVPAGAGQAETVYFNDMTRGPSATLLIGGVTIMSNGAGQPATLLNSGLGLDQGIGPVSEVDREITWLADSPSPSADRREGGIQLTVDGWINSVTIMPQFRVFSNRQGQLPDRLPFQFLTLPPSPHYILVPTNASLMTIDLSLYDTPTFYLDITSSFGEAQFFSDFKRQHQNEDLTFQFGATIVSLDYTPVPEPGIVSLLLLGLIGGWLGRRRLQRLPKQISDQAERTPRPSLSPSDGERVSEGRVRGFSFRNPAASSAAPGCAAVLHGCPANHSKYYGLRNR